MNEPAATAPAAPREITPEERRRAMADVFGEAYAQRFTDPVVFVRRELHSPAAHQFLKRDFPLVSRTLHLELVYRRRIADRFEL